MDIFDPMDAFVCLTVILNFVAAILNIAYRYKKIKKIY